ncbi:divisome protein SepX/GlpR [Mumia sp. DW29H23]|uniref:divisome protein SepX/GlpR n=1 Tax=Mumia sp. DW29H23 TaxID=3421241 RepID=UPI003D68EE6E
MGTGLIFAAVIAIWVAYGVPLALRRHEEATRAGSVTSFSGALRVLTHRKDDAEAESTSETTKVTAKAEEVATAPEPAETPAPRRRYNRRAARVAARRRRRVLLTLLLACAVVGGLSVAGILLPWAAAIPGGLVVVWLVLCRVMVRSEIGRPVRFRLVNPERRAARARRREARRDERRAEREARVDVELEVDPDSEVTVILSGQIEDHDPERRNVMERGPLPDGALDQQVLDAVSVSTTSGTTLWDPVPVTLPTYVTKPAVARTVRTIDFGDGPAVEGHAKGSADDKPGETRRAVGD